MIGGTADSPLKTRTSIQPLSGSGGWEEQSGLFSLRFLLCMEMRIRGVARSDRRDGRGEFRGIVARRLATPFLRQGVPLSASSRRTCAFRPGHRHTDRSAAKRQKRRKAQTLAATCNAVRLHTFCASCAFSRPSTVRLNRERPGIGRTGRIGGCEKNSQPSTQAGAGERRKSLSHRCPPRIDVDLCSRLR